MVEGTTICNAHMGQAGVWNSLDSQDPTLFADCSTDRPGIIRISGYGVDSTTDAEHGGFAMESRPTESSTWAVYRTSDKLVLSVDDEWGTVATVRPFGTAEEARLARRPDDAESEVDLLMWSPRPSNSN